jgi:predicted lipoprotein
MKKKLLLLSSLILLTSCNDFTEKNLEVSTAPDEGISSADLLLGQTDLINAGEFSVEKMLANTGTFVVAPLITKLDKEVAELSAGIDQYCSTIKVFPTVTSEQLSALRKPLQDSWKKAMLTYHTLEVMNFGPAKAVTSTAMSSIYSFDREDKCQIDRTLLLAQRNRFPRFEVIDNYNVRGLDSIEPLIFADPNKSRCQKVNPRLQAFFDLPLIEKENVSCKLMSHLMKDITLKAQELEKSWSVRGGNYTASMLKGTAGTSVEVTNEISQALFVMDTLIKDIKTSYPAGFEVRIEEEITKCPDATCPRATEHLYADMALESLQASFKGFKYLFSGDNPETQAKGYGLDDLLISRGFATIAKNLKTNIDLAIENIEKNKGQSLQEMLKGVDATACEQTYSEDRKVEACALVWDIRKVTDILKNDYLVALAELSAPRQASGDND